ncbi:MAG: bifunctional nuclease family protein [Gemmatimonadaceae bacterium]
MVEVTVAKLGRDAYSNSYVLILQEKGGARLLPIYIGQPEAESIFMQMKSVHRERPITHDLCKSLILGLGGVLRRVQITKVQSNTYFAEMHIARGGDIVQIDARPSDSIAIALRLAAPIYAQESLLTSVEDEEDDEEEEGEAGPVFSEEPQGAAPPPSAEELSAEQLKRHLENLRPEDFGKFNL